MAPWGLRVFQDPLVNLVHHQIQKVEMGELQDLRDNLESREKEGLQD